MSGGDDIFSTRIEVYDYADEYYVGRYLPQYSPNEAASYIQILLGQEAADSLPSEIETAISEAVQGRGLTAKQRKAVELRAMQLSSEWLTTKAYIYYDMSSRESYDFLASREGQNWIVEVKGTTGDASTIMLTKNEVAKHRSRYPFNMLLVVHGISLAGDEAFGGTLRAFVPWDLADEKLTPICYSYRLGV